MNVYRYFLFFMFLVLSFFCTVYASASVVVTGTRIIFDGDLKEKSVTLTNKSNTPYLGQVWTDEGDENSTIKTASGPFVIVPQIFRVNANSTQILKIINTGEYEFPQNRESLFYFNFVQTPAIKASERNENRIVISIKDRMKILYRPVSLIGRWDSLLKSISANYSAASRELTISNSSGYYANIQSVNDFSGKILLSGKMVPPFSSEIYSVDKPDLQYGDKLKVYLISDLGAAVEIDVNI